MSDVNRCLRHVVVHAYQNVAFYRDLFDREGVNPSAVRGVEDLPLLPVISRVDLMAGGTASYLRLGVDPKKLHVKHTTGTTGNPVTVYMNFMERLFRQIVFFDAYGRHARLTLPLILVDVGPERKDAVTEVFSRGTLVTRVSLFRSMPVREQISILTRLKPTVIAGRPSTLWELACALKDQGITPPRPRVIVSNVEMLFGHVRLLVEEVFGCPVVDYYNCEEVGNLAWQCPRHPDLMHPNTALGWLEAVDRQGIAVLPGMEGRLVVTNFFNYTMPFIRYSMGDRGVILERGKCACGFDGPVMRLTEGRDENFIVLPDGREITPRLMFDVINTGFPHDLPGWNMIDAIRTFQIVQEKDDRIVVRVVAGPAYSEALWPPVRSNLARLHPSMRLEVECVDSLAPPPGKKFHQVLGKLSSRWKNEREGRSVSV